MEDIPYSTLKQESRNYQILMFRDKYNSSYANIAKVCGVSSIRAAQICKRMRLKQIALYINHIALVLGHEDIFEVKKIYQDAFKSYQDFSYACAYLEKKYQDILTEYRSGEPGVAPCYTESLPAFMPELPAKTVTRIVKLRDTQHPSYAKIGRELNITQQKVRHTYALYYHKKVLKLFRAIQKRGESKEEKALIEQYWYGSRISPKEAYDKLTAGLAPVENAEETAE